MDSPIRARLALRAATADHHARVDHVFSAATLADREGYVAFLRAQAAAHLPVEAALDRDGASGLLPDWPQRRRGAALADDLSALDAAVPPPIDDPAFRDKAALLGAIYVLEGSRLGGALLRRQVPQGWPAAFLGPGPTAPWRGLIEVLDAELTREEEVAVAVASARRVFDLFEASGHAYLGRT